MSNNLFLRHIETVPALLASAFDQLDAEAARLALLFRDRPLKAVYLYGCGDSLCAASGAAAAFMELVRIPAFALSSLQISRYAAGYCMPAPDEVLAVGMSNSGRVIRTLEATAALSKQGFDPILVTSQPDSESAKAAGHVFHAPVPNVDPIPLPGVRSYCVAQLSLYLLAAHLAFEKSQLTAEELDAELLKIREAAESLEAAKNAALPVLERFAAFSAECERVEFVSAGPCRASADFGMAKTLEAAGYTALSPELEEFAHMNFFSLDPERIPTVLIAPADSRSLTRTLEMEASMIHQGRPYIVLTDCGAFRADAAQLVKTPAHVPERYAPLVFSYLTATLAACMPLREGDVYLHGHEGPYHEEGFPTIMTSEIVLD